MCTQAQQWLDQMEVMVGRHPSIYDVQQKAEQDQLFINYHLDFGLSTIRFSDCSTVMIDKHRYCVYAGRLTNSRYFTA